MQSIIQFLKKTLNPELGVIQPIDLKSALLKSGATAHVIRTLAHESSEGLIASGNLVRQAAAVLPSAGVALCMHNHVLLVCARYQDLFEGNAPLLRDVASKEALVASAFAEGIPGRDIFSPGLTLTQSADGFHLQGSKRPCSLSSIADYFIMSASHAGRENSMALLLVPNRSDAIQYVPFWGLDTLTECDSNEVRFMRLPLMPESISAYSLEQMQGALAYGMATFNFLAGSAYAGALDALQACIAPRVASQDAIARVLTEQNIKIGAWLGQMAAIAHGVEHNPTGVQDVLGLRYVLEQVLEEAASFALRTCGGVEVTRNPAPLRLYSTIQLFKFHPVSKFQFITSVMQPTQ